MIYFDNASSTKPLKEVIDLFCSENEKNYANPNSINSFGMHNFTTINRTKNEILKLFKLSSDYEVIITSGATESNNIAILGYARKNINKGKHLITSKIEHESVLNCFKELEKEGFEVTYLDVDNEGHICLDQLEKSIRKDTILVALMASNNEVGSNLDIEKSREIISKFPKCVFYSDVAQAIGKIKVNYNLLDFFGFSYHKIHGLKGIGLLVKKKKINLDSIVYGGNQENGLRSGTIDYPSFVASTLALKQCLLNLNSNYQHVKELNTFIRKELGNNSEIEINTSKIENPYILSISLKSKSSSVVVEALSSKNIFVNSVSACNSKNDEPSHVLLAMNKSNKIARNVIRISFSHFNTIEECKEFISELNSILYTIKG